MQVFSNSSHTGVFIKLRTVTKLRTRGVSRIFERGGPISLGSLKKGHQILKGGGSNGLKGGVQYI